LLVEVLVSVFDPLARLKQLHLWVEIVHYPRLNVTRAHLARANVGRVITRLTNLGHLNAEAGGSSASVLELALHAVFPGRHAPPAETRFLGQFVAKGLSSYLSCDQHCQGQKDQVFYATPLLL
jgi:hypothetical protein